MHPRKIKWRVTYMLMNRLGITKVFDTEARAQEHVKGVFAGKHLLRNRSGHSYTVYPISQIDTVQFEQFEEERTIEEYRGPSWNV